jgi:hypothetical protein
MDDWKGKAAGYIEDASKKKSELVEKAAHLKKEYEDSQRRKLEDWVFNKEVELKNLEKSLKKREKLLKEKELKLKNKLFVRFIGIMAGLSVIGFFTFASFKATNITGGYASTSQTNNSDFKSPPPQKSEPYTQRESAVYSTYNDMDITNPNFDVGGYCLKKEKQSNITFEECLGVAAAKIASKR